jgi:hypothetical protein
MSIYYGAKNVRDDVDALIDVARTANADFHPPMTDDEVIKLAHSARGYTQRGENRFGRRHHVQITHEEVDGLLRADPDAYLLLSILHRRHWGRDFVLANAMATGMLGGGWTESLVACGFVICSQIIWAKERLVLGRGDFHWQIPSRDQDADTIRRRCRRY